MHMKTKQVILVLILIAVTFASGCSLFTSKEPLCNSAKAFQLSEQYTSNDCSFIQETSNYYVFDCEGPKVGDTKPRVYIDKFKCTVEKIEPIKQEIIPKCNIAKGNNAAELYSRHSCNFVNAVGSEYQYLCTGLGYLDIMINVFVKKDNCAVTRTTPAKTIINCDRNIANAAAQNFTKNSCDYLNTTDNEYVFLCTGSNGLTVLTLAYVDKGICEVTRTEPYAEPENCLQPDALFLAENATQNPCSLRRENSTEYWFGCTGFGMLTVMTDVHVKKETCSIYLIEPTQYLCPDVLNLMPPVIYSKEYIDWVKANCNETKFIY